MTIHATVPQARRYMLRRQGLLGARRFKGADGLIAYVRQAGCVQYDPVDICGKSHELALLARVEGFTREMLDDVMYKRRALIDYYDKNMCILPVEDWPYLEPMREFYRRDSRGREETDKAAPEILRRIKELGCASSKELSMKERVDWYWSATTLSRATLETLYFRGDLVVHHKQGAVKSYALAGDCLPRELLDAPCPFKTEADKHVWQIKRRVGAVGMLWDSASDALLCTDGWRSVKADARHAAFGTLIERGELIPVEVEGVGQPMYIWAEDAELMEKSASPFTGERRVRFLAPLDCMLWDRKLISKLFDFSYQWEIYTPKEKLKYAHYTLPVLYGERFAGRVEPVCDRKARLLRVRRFWPESGFKPTKAFERELCAYADRLREFHGVERVVWGEGDDTEPSRSYVQ